MSDAMPPAITETLPTDTVREVFLTAPAEKIVLQVENQNGAIAFVTRPDLPPGTLRLIGRPVGLPFGVAGVDLDLRLWQAPFAVGEVVHVRAGRTAWVAEVGIAFVPAPIAAEAWRVPPSRSAATDDRRHMNVIIEAPIGVAVRLGSGSGSIEVQTAATSGDIALASGSGSIRLNRARANGVIIAHTGSGTITATDLRSPAAITLRSGSGSVAAQRVVCPAVHLVSQSGSLRLADHAWTPEGALIPAPVALTLISGSGRVEVDDAEATALQLESGNGSIAFRGRLIAQQPSRIRNGNGSIALTLRPDSAAAITAHTGNGSISLDPATETRLTPSAPRTRTTFDGRLGADGAALDIRSGSGRISIAVA